MPLGPLTHCPFFPAKRSSDQTTAQGQTRPPGYSGFGLQRAMHRPSSSVKGNCRPIGFSVQYTKRLRK
jgi:hypothetical protein